MNNKKKVIGLTLATAAALAFASLPATATFAQGVQVKCYGINSCKGQGACKSVANSCKGQNACKGHGIVMEDNEQACVSAGGSITESNPT